MGSLFLWAFENQFLVGSVATYYSVGSVAYILRVTHYVGFHLVSF